MVGSSARGAGSASGHVASHSRMVGSRDEGSNNGGPGYGSRSRRASFMPKQGTRNDWRGCKAGIPKALGGHRASQSTSVSPEKRNSGCLRGSQAHWYLASTVDVSIVVFTRPPPVKMRFFGLKGAFVLLLP